MKILSFNITGIKSSVTKGLQNYLEKLDADIVCLQEVKSNIQDPKLKIKFDPVGYYQFINLAEKKGYSGVMILSKVKPLNCLKFSTDTEGRLLVAEFEKFWIVSCYSPNIQKGEERLEYRLRFEDRLSTWLKNQTKPCILCGDLNVCHDPKLDVRNYKKTTPSCTDEERNCFQRILDIGFVDAFRYLYPNKIEYSYFDYKIRSRAGKVHGFRLGYCLCHSSIKSEIKNVETLSDWNISDHEPILLTIDL